MKKISPILALIAAASLALTGCSSTPTTPATPATDSGAATPASGSFQAPAAGEKGAADNPVKIGIVGPELEYDWLKAEAAKEGLYIEYTTLSDYNQPNPAVASGELDLNQFQHILYLGNYNVESGKPLVALASTAIYPLPLYSNQYKAISEIPQDAQIAIPNDETNQARAISVLAQNGLLTLKDGVDRLYATPVDIDETKSKVKVTPVSAEQTPRSLDDPNIAGAIINNNWAKDAGLKPDQAIAKDDANDPGSAPFINVWAGTADKLNDKVYAEIFRLANEQGWKDALQEQFAGSGVLIDQTPEQLAATLSDVEAQLKAHQK